MNRNLIRWAGMFVAVAASSAWVAAADSKPRLPAGGGAATKPAPAPKPAAGGGGGDKPSPVDGSKRVSLENGTVTFLPPDGWLDSPVNRRPTREIYFATTKNALMLVELTPAASDTTADMGPAIARKLKQTRATNKQKLVMDPTIEKDDRFVVRIHEKFEDKEGVADQVHLYKKVGARVLMVTIKTIAQGEDGKAHIAAAEATAASAEGKGK